MAENLIFTQNLTDNDDAIYGEFLNPIKMALLHESDMNTKKKGVLDYLFNIEKSKNSSEATIGQRGFTTFEPKTEGEKAEYDTIDTTYSKVIRHTSFGKTFVITEEAASDAKWGLTAQMKRDAEEFVRSYYSTRHLLAEKALVNATANGFTFGSKNGKTIDTRVGDEKPLFSNAHIYFNNDLNTRLGPQSNYYHGLDTDGIGDLEEQIGELAHKVSCFKDDNGEMTGYTADTIIVPGSRGKLIRMIKKIAGTENALGSGNNDINIQYGNWNVIVLPHWEATEDEIMIMSSEANKSFRGNMFYQRSPLSIKTYVDVETRNLTYNGFARMGIGFNNWKHIIRARVSADGEKTTAL